MESFTAEVRCEKRLRAYHSLPYWVMNGRYGPLFFGRVHPAALHHTRALLPVYLLAFLSFLITNNMGNYE